MFRFACSVALRGGRGAAGRYCCVWGAITVFWPLWVCPTHRCVLSPSILLRRPAALYGAGPALHAVPVLGSSTKAWTRLDLRFVPSPARAAQAARSLTGALSPGAVRLLPSTVSASVSTRTSRVRAPCVCSGELASSCDSPGGCRSSRISGSVWSETGSPFAVW